MSRDDVRYRRAGGAEWRTGHELLRIKGEHVAHSPGCQHENGGWICGNLYTVPHYGPRNRQSR